jgi:asparagine synthase (glutamine-hydrolysing)
LNHDLLATYLSFLWVPAPNTLFREIFLLEPGHSLTLDRNGISKKRYWNPQLTIQDENASEIEWREMIDMELRRVIKEQMLSDVPLGAFLSGGVDSSTIIYYMNQVRKTRVTTYTTGFSVKDLAKDVILSDLESARLAAKVLDVRYNEMILSPDAVRILPALVWHMDEPVADPAAITTYLICRAAKEECSVMLSGVGGDEIFGGYPRYLATQLAERYLRIPAFARERLLKPLMSRVPTGSRASIRNLKKFIKSADMPFEERYLGYLTYYSKEEMNKLLKLPFAWDRVFEHHRELFRRYKSADPIQSMMNLDLMTFLPNLNLMYTDKMSSAVAVEVRVPYLDHLLIENVARIPGRFKIHNGRSKYILKKLAEGFLPKEIVWRKKAGFGAPIGAWLKGQLKEMMLDLLSEESVKRRGYFNYAFVSQLIKNHLNGREYNANHLWQLMTFELWHQIFLDGNKKERFR